jgi:hypothetical protein
MLHETVAGCEPQTGDRSSVANLITEHLAGQRECARPCACFQCRDNGPALVGLSDRNFADV